MIVLSAYPLSRTYRGVLEAALDGHPNYVTLPELRRLPPTQILRSLRRGRGKPCVLAIEDASSYGVLPVLETLAVVSGASSVEIAHPDASMRRISRARAGMALPPLATATVGGRAAVRRAKRELTELASTPRIDTSSRAAPESLLYVNPNLWFGLKAGGSVGHVAGVVNGLSRKGVRVTLASAPDPVLVDDTVRFVRIEPPTPFGLPFAVNGYRLQHRLLGSLERVADDARLIYQRHAVSSYVGVQLSRRRQVPLVLEYNGSEVWAAEHWGRGLPFANVARAAEDVSLRHAHLVVTISDALADELRARGVPDERIVCYPNGVDAERFDPVALAPAAAEARRRLGLSPSSILVAFIGTFGRWHGAERFAEAAARLRRDSGEWVADRNVHFLFVGDGVTMPDVRAAVADAEDVVSFSGLVPQDEAPSLLAAADILVSPHVPNADGSRFFGSPTKLFEYMAVGKAIVASNLDQIGDVLGDSLRVEALPSGPPKTTATEVAVLTTPGSVDDLATAIRFLCDRADWRETVGSNARTLVLARYTWEHHVDAILAGMTRIAG